SSVHLGFSFAGSPVDEARLGSGLKSDDEHGLSALAAEGGVQGVAAFPPRIQTRIGERLTMWVDMGRLHFFDVESGRALR
ncbi:MAG: hypothetical protein PHU75_02340, partial [Candidatus Nanopelagicales bacterium]|nr:hypothetical protein [Candidatus Nanopelagicales bacterium]